MAGELIDLLVGGAGGGSLSVLYQKFMTDRKLDNTANAVLAVKDSLAAHKLHAAETFATKSDVEKAIEPVQKTLDTISLKIDRLGEKIHKTPKG